MQQIGNYAKGIVVVGGAVITSLSPFYGDRSWFVAVAAGTTALVAILVPNQPKQ